MSRRTNEAALPSLPRLRPTWTTWMWLGFAVAVVVAMVAGFLRAGRPFWHSSEVTNENRSRYALELQSAPPRAIDRALS
jgi:hypothetical protein